MHPIHVVLTGLLLAAPVQAEEPLRLSLPETGPPNAVTLWFGLYVQDVKVGWARAVAGRKKDGALIEDFTFEATLAERKEKIDVRGRERVEYEGRAPYRITRAESQFAADRTRETVTLERAGEGYRWVLASPGGEQVKTVPSLDYTFEDAWTSVQWFQSERAVGESLTVRSFDLEELQVDSETYHVDKVSDAIVQGVATRYYRGRLVTSAEGEIGLYTVTSTGIPVQLTVGGIFEMRLEDEKTAKQPARGQDLFVLGNVSIDQPLGDPESVENLVLQVGGEGAAKLAPGARQSVEVREDGTRLLELGPAHGVAEPATEKDVNEALASTSEFPADDERIAALARRAIGDAGHDAEKVQRLVRFVSEYVEDTLSAAEAFTALDVVAARTGDCTEHSALFTALARAAGIPARTVSGFVYMGDEAKAFGGHQWNEVVLDGRWVPVDPTWNQTEIDATHVAMGHGDRGAFAHVGAIGRLTFRLVSMKRKE